MPNKFDDFVYRVVTKNAMVPQSLLDGFLQEAGRAGVTLISLLAKNRSVNEGDVMRLLAQELNLEYVNLKSVKIDKSIINTVPYKFAWHYKFVPLKIEHNALTVAVGFPLDIKTQDELRLHFGCDIRMVITTEKDIIEELKKLYGLGADTIEKILAAPSGLDKITESGSREQVEDIDTLAEDASVINLVNQIIVEAYRKRATDIHIEPYRGELKLRYRIDGVLYDANVPVNIKQLIRPILSRIKIMANLNIVERRLPQDGRIAVKTQDQVLDLRVSFIPTPYGESVVLRMLPTMMLFNLEKLGLAASDQKFLEQLITKPHGIIFVTGPTGSGKTTTLYTCLNKINTRERKIITIEDPIEYEMPGITQIQVMSEVGLTFACGLRSILRHDPDIIMVGEVRDLETAEIAIRVALTGHLVFSTLHTNDAASGITRLIDIGVEAYLVASSVEAFIAQRLVRVICPFCKKEDPRALPEVKAQIASGLNLDSSDEVKIYKGSGCEECNFTGFHGRTAIYEILLMDEVIREMVLKKPSSENIKLMAMARGMRTLRQDGWRKVLDGVTTPEEIMNVTEEEKYPDAEGSDAAVAGEGGVLMPVGEVSPYSNRRLFMRLDAKVPVHWKIYVSDNKEGDKLFPEYQSATKNISAGGLLFATKEAVPKASVLELKIDLPQELPITCLAKVVRVAEIETEKGYDVAVCFLDLSGADRSRLNKFVIEKFEEMENKES
jgi:type II secretory ATPase GspE/PulE/Tfp pilus assembly ATPase PilB-like protein